MDRQPGLAEYTIVLTVLFMVVCCMSGCFWWLLAAGGLALVLANLGPIGAFINWLVTGVMAVQFWPIVISVVLILAIVWIALRLIPRRH